MAPRYAVAPVTPVLPNRSGERPPQSTGPKVLGNVPLLNLSARTRGPHLWRETRLSPKRMHVGDDGKGGLGES